jgi:predicted ATPase/DNA-binding CsgD family transcriptional regulator
MGAQANQLAVQAHNLPLQPTPLVGRSQELTLARQHLLSNEVRLLTLTGPGGVGKTRLAVAVVVELIEAFPQGVWFVDLTPVKDPELVLPAVAQVLGVHEATGQPLVELVAAYLRDQHLLLVLDNFEQVVPAAPVLASLLESCPYLRLLVTSRERLRLRWEWSITVPSLALPDLGTGLDLQVLANTPAVALFVQRAQAHQATFALTAENAPAIATLCARLDGLPLALELAAARVGVLTPTEILARIECGLALPRQRGPDVPARHQTLEAAIQWSYTMLPVEEQRLFRRLGVFVGGWRLDVAEAVIKADEFEEDIFESLSSLVEKSLVQVGAQPGQASRFRMLETIREYALEQLAASSELEALQRQHANYYVTVAEQTLVELKGRGQQAWFDYLEQEHDNLRAALRWSSQGGESLLGLRIAAGLWFFWWLRGHVSEGRGWLGVTLAQNGKAPAEFRLVALEGLGTLAGWQGDYEQGVRFLDEALNLSRMIGDNDSTARVLGRLGWIAWLNGRDERANELIKALDSCREGAEPWSLAYSFLSVGGLLYEVRQEKAAITALEEALIFFREVEENHGVAFALTKLALLRQRQGAAERARELAQEGIEFARSLHDTHIIAYCADDVARLVGKQGAPEPLSRLLGGVDNLRETINLLRTPQEQVAYNELAEALQRQLGEEKFIAAWAEGQKMAADQVAEVALTLLSQQPPADAPKASPPVDLLSEREYEVLRLVAEGLSNQQIGDQLFITERTVRFHVTSIFNKLGADNRAQAVALATQRGLL